MKKFILFGLAGLLIAGVTFCALVPEQPQRLTAQALEEGSKNTIDLLDSLTKNKDIAKFIRPELEALATAAGNQGEIRLRPKNSPILFSIMDAICNDISSVLHISKPRAVFLITNHYNNLYYGAAASKEDQAIAIGKGELEAYLLSQKSNYKHSWHALLHTLAHEMGHLCDHELEKRELNSQRWTLLLTIGLALCIFSVTNCIANSFMSQNYVSCIAISIIIAAISALIFGVLHNEIAINDRSQAGEFFADKKALEFLHKRFPTMGTNELKKIVKFSLADANPKEQGGLVKNMARKDLRHHTSAVSFIEKINSIIDEQLGLSTHPSNKQRIAFVDEVLSPVTEQPDELRLALQRVVDWLLRS